jgi:hypothetical protein
MNTRDAPYGISLGALYGECRRILFVENFVAGTSQGRGHFNMTETSGWPTSPDDSTVVPHSGGTGFLVGTRLGSWFSTARRGVSAMENAPGKGEAQPTSPYTSCRPEL